jgi:hypothetical protein
VPDIICGEKLRVHDRMWGPELPPLLILFSSIFVP